MIYEILRPLVRRALQFYCRRLSFAGLENIPIGQGKPVLFCSTHSNSFLDALFLAVGFEEEVFPLARGDAFRKPSVEKLLRKFRMIPIFRQSEGEEHAEIKNELSFKECQALFQTGKWVLIFPEGVCKHQTSLLPMKKGAALLVHRAWLAGIPLQVIPVGITYDSFTRWGKKCDVIFGKPIEQTEFKDIEDQALFYEQFNTSLSSALSKLFPTPYQYQNNPLYNGYWSIFLYYADWVFQAPLYAVSYIIGKKTAGKTIFFDSTVVGVLAILAPIYYIIIAIVAIYIFL